MYVNLFYKSANLFTLYREENNEWYVVWWNLFLLLLACTAWLCLGPSLLDLPTFVLFPVVVALGAKSVQNLSILLVDKAQYVISGTYCTWIGSRPMRKEFNLIFQPLELGYALLLWLMLHGMFSQAWYLDNEIFCHFISISSKAAYIKVFKGIVTTSRHLKISLSLSAGLH